MPRFALVAPWSRPCSLLALFLHFAFSGCGPAPTAPETGGGQPLPGSAGSEAAPPSEEQPAPSSVQRLDLSAPIRALAFAPDGTSLVVGTERGEVVFFSWPALAVRARVVANDSPVATLEHRADGGYVAVVSGDASLRVVRTRDAAVVSSMPAAEGGELRMVEFLGSGPWVAIADATPAGLVRFVHLSDATQQCTWQLPADPRPLAMLVYDEPHAQVIVARHQAHEGVRRRSSEPCDASRERGLAVPVSFGLDAAHYYRADGSQALVGSTHGALLVSTEQLLAHHVAELPMAHAGAPMRLLRPAPGVVHGTYLPFSEVEAAQAGGREPRASQHVWSLNTPSPEPLPRYSSQRPLAVHPTGEFLMEAHGTSLARVALTEGTPSAQLVPQAGLGAPADIVDLSANGRWALAARSLGQEILLMDLAAGAVVARLPLSGVLSARFTRHSDGVVAAGTLFAKQWSLEDMRLVGLAYVGSPTSPVAQVAVVPAGVVATTNAQGNVFAYLPRGTYALGEPSVSGAWNTGFFASSLSPLGVARDAALVATATGDTLWSLALENGARGRRTLPAPVASALVAPALSPDGRTVAVMETGGRVTLLPVSEGPALRTFDAPEFGGLGTLHLGETHLILRDSARTWVWDVRSGQLVATLRANMMTGATNDLLRTGPEETLARFTGDGGLQLWDPVSDTVLARIGDARAALRASVVLPEAGAFLTVDDHAARRWTPGNPERVSTTLFQSTDPHNAILDAAAVLGGRGVAFSRAGLHVWDLTRGARAVATSAPQGTNFLALATNPSGTTLVAAAGFGALSVIDVEGARELHAVDLARLDARIGRGTLLSALALSADGRTLAFAGAEPGSSSAAVVGALRLESPPRLLWLETTRAPLADIAFSRDGDMLATCGDTGLVLRAVASGAVRWAPTGLTTQCHQVEPGPGGSYWLAALDTVTLLRPESDTRELRWGASGTVGRLHAAPDGARVTWTLGDGTFELLHTGEGARPVRVVPAAQDGFVMSTRGGSYWASQQGLRAVRFQQGGQVVAADQLDAEHNAPDRVLADLGLGSAGTRRGFQRAREARASRLAARGATHPDFARGPRVVSLSGIPVVTESAELTLRVSAEAREGSLASVRAWVDGVPVPGLAGLPASGPRAEVTLPLALRPGLNTVEVSAVDASGRESQRLVRQVTRRGPARAGRLFVLTVGVGDYGSPDVDLEFSVKDARDLARALAQVGSGYSAVETRVLVDAEATREGVLRTGRAFLERSGPDDHVIVFFAGHGLRASSGEFFFAASGVTPANLETRGLSMSALESLLDGIGARRRLMLLDACFSGIDNGSPAASARPAGAAGTLRVGRSRGFRVTDAPSPESPGGTDEVREQTLLTSEAGLAELGRGTGTVVLASAAGREYALESEAWSNGVFTYALIDGLRSGAADRDGDGVVHVSELQRHVSERVQALTEGAQSPMASRQNLVVDFALVGGRPPQSASATPSVGAPAAPTDVLPLTVPAGVRVDAIRANGCEVLLTGSAGQLQLTSIDGGPLPTHLPDTPGTSRRVSVTDGRARVTDSATGAELRVFTLRRLVSAALDASGDFLVVGTSDGEALVVHVATGEILARQQVGEVSLSPEHGLRRVSASVGARRVLAVDHRGQAFVWTRMREGLHCGGGGER